MNKNNDEEWDIIANQLNEYRKKFIKFKLYASNWGKQNCYCIIKKKEVIKMNKEECLNALKIYEKLFDFYQSEYYLPNDTREKFINSINCIENLIDEHFENKPLQFSDLKTSEPYWNNKEKEWCYFATLHNDLKTGVKITISSPPLMSAFKFEENTFYRKEVNNE